MRTPAIIAFVVGIVWVQQWSVLPAVGWCWLAVPLLVCCYYCPRYIWLYAGVLGLAWAVLCGHWRQAVSWPEELVGHDVTVTGYIASIPDKHERGVRFDFAVDEYLPVADYAVYTLPAKLRLSWYGESGPLPGEYWRLTVRLKPAHGFMNPGTF
ncbi:MAG TPA: ComEC/Rec2 family competence protein, partial [Gammaproteobacteria bacterium]